MMATSSRARLPAACVIGLAATAIALPARADSAVDQCIRASDQGQEQRDGGHYTRAAAAFARCSAVDCPALVRRDCARWLEDVVAQTPTIVPSARDAAGNDLAAVRVLVDGAEVARQLDGRPIELDPGPHVVSFQGPGGHEAEERVVVRAGEKNRILAVTLGAAGGPTTPPPVPSAPRPSHAVPVLPLVVGGAAVVSFGVGLYFGLKARSDLSGIEAEPCASTRTCSASDVDAVRTKLVVSDVLIGAAAVGAATAVTLFFLTRDGEDRPPQARMELRASPVAGGVQGMLRATF